MPATEPTPAPEPSPTVAPARRRGFVPLPLRCPHCERRLQMPAVVLHGGVLRCGGCQALQYVILVQSIRLAFVADVTSAEVIQMSADGLTAEGVLTRLGAMRGGA